MCSTVLHTAGLLRDEFIGAVSLDVNEVRHRNMTLFGTVFATAVVATSGEKLVCSQSAVLPFAWMHVWSNR